MTAIDQEYLRSRLLRRRDDTHKGDYGHLLVVAGCQNMPGAAVLATGAALQSGCGLVTLHSTERALQAAVNGFPSAMLSENPGELFRVLPPWGLSRYSAIAVGPGLGRAPETREALFDLLQAAKAEGIRTVLDADALNILSEVRDWPGMVPEGSVLTPHLGEFRRLFPGESGGEKEAAIVEFCERTRSVLVEKGFHTRVYTPSCDILVNTTGNPGLAKGGSGDVLTGLIGGLMARGYSSADAACLGVWIHGYAGDCLTLERTAEAWSSRDLIDRLYLGFKELSSHS